MCACARARARTQEALHDERGGVTHGLTVLSESLGRVSFELHEALLDRAVRPR